MTVLITAILRIAVSYFLLSLLLSVFFITIITIVIINARVARLAPRSQAGRSAIEPQLHVRDDTPKQLRVWDFGCWIWGLGVRIWGLGLLV